MLVVVSVVGQTEGGTHEASFQDVATGQTSVSASPAPSIARGATLEELPPQERSARVKALVWFWLIDEILSANLVYQDGHEIGSTTPSDEAMTKIMMMMMA